MTLVPVGEFLPDQAAFMNSGAPNVLNVTPITEKDYGPIPSMSPYSTALTKKCQGAAVYSDPSNNVYAFAGDQNDLYLMSAGSAPTFNKVSLATGGYNAAVTGFWKFTEYGNYVIATDYNDPIQVFTLDTSTAFSNLAVLGPGSLTATIGGTITVGDTVSLTIENSVLLPTAQTASHTVATGDTTTTIAAALTAFIDANSSLAGVGIAATSTANVITIRQNGAISSQTQVTYTISGSRTETVVLAPTTGYLAGGTDGAPNAKYIAIIRNFLVAANTYDTTNGAKPQRIWWSGKGNPLSWPTPDTQAAYNVQSDFQDIYGDYGQITGIVSDLGTADGAVFFQRAVIRLAYQGPPTIFSVLPAENVRGTSSPGSIVQQGAIIYYHADDGFYAFDGTYSQPVGFQKIDNFFQQNADPNYVSEMVGGADPLSKIIYWSYATVGSAGVPNQTLLYNTVLQRWSVANFGAQYFVRGLSFGYTLDQLDQFGTLANLPQPLDSPVWAGGRLQLQAFDTSNRLNYLNGPNLAALVDTSEQQVFPESRAYITNCRPLVDGGVPSVSIGYRNRLEDPVTFNMGAPMNALGNCPQRAEGRYLRARIQVPAGANWTHISGVDVTAAQMGWR